MAADAPPRTQELREMFNSSWWLVRIGSPWRYRPNARPPWPSISQQTPHWAAAGGFVAERSFGRMARFRQLARDDERLAATLVGFHRIAFACLLLQPFAPLFAEVPHTL